MFRAWIAFVRGLLLRSTQIDGGLGSIALLEPVLDAMRHEKTFVRAMLHVHPEQPDVFQLHETWKDREEVLSVQLKRPYRAEWHEALEHLLARPREIEVWRPIWPDG